MGKYIFMPNTLQEYINDIDVIEKKFETHLAILDAQEAAIKLEKHKLHSGVNRKLATLSRKVAKAAEANAKTQ